MQQAAALFASTILTGRMVHVFGSGHSRMMVEEMWPRYGSFPGFNPIVERQARGDEDESDTAEA